MSRTLALILPVLAATAALPAQGLMPGVSATLRAESELLPANADVVLVLSIAIKQNADLPADLLTGVMLDTKIGGAAGLQVREAGHGANASFAAGTKIERRLVLPSSKLVGSDASASPDGIVHVEVAWPGLDGANCVVQVAPDASQLAVEDLDLMKTKVVLVTSMGNLTIAFRSDKAPNTVANFVKLAKEGFYDGTKFHRVIRNFMIQGGDPNSKNDDAPDTWGQGGPGYQVNAEFNDMRHVRGVLSMARSQDINSAGSQFFIVHRDSPHLDNQYTAFGNLEKGADVLDAIATTRCGANDRPIDPVILRHAIVLPVKKEQK